MFESLLGIYNKPTYGLKGIVTSAKADFVSGNRMTMSANGRYLASGEATNTDGTGCVYITDVSNPYSPALTKTIILPEWKKGGSVGTYTRAGDNVKGSDDLKTIVTNSAYNGVDMGAIFIIKLDADWNVVPTTTKILASNTVVNDIYGQFLDMNADGTRVAVSATGFNSSTGRVFIYSLINGSWVQEKVIDRPAGETCYSFGMELNMSRDGNLIAVSSSPNASGSCRVFLYKRQSVGVWDLVSTINDTRNITNTGRTVGYLSGDGKKLFVTYSYNNTAVGVPEAGVDIYDVDPVTGATTLIQTVPNGIPGGGYGLVASVSYDGSTFIGTKTLTAANKYESVACVQRIEPGGEYHNAWKFSSPDLGTSPINPVVDQKATKWVGVDRLYRGIPTINSFFVGR